MMRSLRSDLTNSTKDFFEKSLPKPFIILNLLNLGVIALWEKKKPTWRKLDNRAMIKMDIKRGIIKRKTRRRNVFNMATT
jgi:hypothetical protein